MAPFSFLVFTSPYKLFAYFYRYSKIQPMYMNAKRIALSLLAAIPGLAGVAQTQAPNGWHLSDPKTSHYYGLSLDKAYSFLKRLRRLNCDMANSANHRFEHGNFIQDFSVP